MLRYLLPASLRALPKAPVFQGERRARNNHDVSEVIPAESYSGCVKSRLCCNVRHDLESEQGTFHQRAAVRDSVAVAIQLVPRTV